MRRIFILLSILGIAAASASYASGQDWKTVLAVNPDPPSVGEPNVVGGCGYIPSDPDTRVYIYWNTTFKRPPYGDGDIRTKTTSDADGCFSLAWIPIEPGLYSIYVTQYNKSGAVAQVKAKIIFEVH